LQRQIALLRGINLGSRRRVAMADLRKLLEGQGYGDVRTLLQSGNVVLSSGAAPESVALEIERGIEAELGLAVEVIVRTRGELAAVIELNPLADVVDDPKRYQVSFLSAEPDAAAIEAIAAADFAPERFAHIGREIYAWHADGIQGSRLAKLIADKRLGVTATARNWNTVTKLLELADE
jgi:uncharacterized protein (DUF1697 family)